jgi:hypothetical protein
LNRKVRALDLVQIMGEPTRRRLGKSAVCRVEALRTLEVRAAVPGDVPGILALISRAYPGVENYSAGQVSGQINNFPEGQFVAALEGVIVGYCASSRIDEAVAFAPHDWPRSWAMASAAVTIPRATGCTGLKWP